MTDAQICSRMGWIVGDILEGDEGYGPERIQITAIGEESILAKEVYPEKSTEALWSLDCRDWRKVSNAKSTCSSCDQQELETVTLDVNEHLAMQQCKECGFRKYVVVGKTT